MVGAEKATTKNAKCAKYFPPLLFVVFAYFVVKNAKPRKIPAIRKRRLKAKPETITRGPDVSSLPEKSRQPRDPADHGQRLLSRESANSKAFFVQKSFRPWRLTPVVGSHNMSDPDFVFVVVSREEVLALDTRSAMSVLRALITSPAKAKHWFERVDLSINGFNEVADELFEIPEVRNYVQKLDDEFPFWLFFLSKRLLGLKCIAYCLLPPFLTPEAKAIYFPVRLDQLLTTRWFPAMNQICEWTGMTEREIEILTDRSVKYLLAGPE
jgi:hypothetical protein